MSWMRFIAKMMIDFFRADAGWILSSPAAI